MIPWLALPADAVTPYVGAEWRPLSRGDLAWVSEERTTGLAVGGDDGLVRPQIMAYGGAWLTDHIAVHGALGVARLQTTSWEDDIWVQRHWGVVRPAVDVRAALLARTDPRPIPWVLFGAHVDLPSSRDTSNGYTEDEEAQADEAATLDRYRLGALGGRVGMGADLGLLPSLRIGLQWTVDWQRSLFLRDEPDVVTSLLTTEGALIVELAWARREETEPETGTDEE